MHRSLRCLRSKEPKPTKGVFPMQQLSKQPAFELGQIVATPGALAALKKSGQQPGEFLTRHVNREWRFVRRGPQGKRLQPRARVPALERLPNKRRRQVV